MKKHWTSFLSEASKRITELGDKILSNEQEILRCQKNIDGLRMMNNGLENNATFLAKEHWTESEIDSAKRTVFIQEQDTFNTAAE